MLFNLKYQVRYHANNYFIFSVEF